MLASMSLWLTAESWPRRHLLIKPWPPFSAWRRFQSIILCFRRTRNRVSSPSSVTDRELMPLLQWSAAPDGRYWIDVLVGSHALRVMVDLGLVDPLDRVGFELDHSAYQRLKQSGCLTRFDRRPRRDASGRVSWSESGLGSASCWTLFPKRLTAPWFPYTYRVVRPGFRAEWGLFSFIA